MFVRFFEPTVFKTLKLTTFREILLHMQETWFPNKLFDSFANNIFNSLLKNSLLKKSQWEMEEIQALCKDLINVKNKCHIYLQTANTNTPLVSKDVKVTRILLAYIDNLYCLKNIAYEEEKIVPERPKSPSCASS